MKFIQQRILILLLVISLIITNILSISSSLNLGTGNNRRRTHHLKLSDDSTTTSKSTKPILSNLSSSNYSTLQTVSKKDNIFYTQGLLYEPETKTLVESGGLYNESILVRMKYPSMEIVNKINLDKKYFAEGIAKCGSHIYQLTWKEKTVLKYNSKDLSLVEEFPMDERMNQGWGLAKFDDNNLIATDSGTQIFMLDCNEKLKIKKAMTVMYKGSPLDRINDLVYVNGKEEGFIFANRYFDENIYKIDLEGNVVNTYNMHSFPKFEMDEKKLSSEKYNTGDVLNGIAYDPIKKVFLLSGKRWGHIFETELN